MQEVCNDLLPERDRCRRLGISYLRGTGAGGYNDLLPERNRCRRFAMIHLRGTGAGGLTLLSYILL